MEELKATMKPIKKKSLYLKISDSIYTYIKVNALQPGDKLPSERDMSSMLQTSRNSVREALRILEDRGLIYVKTGCGVFIKDPYGEKNTLSIKLTECSLENIQELQSTLDHQAVQNALERASREEKQELISIASDMVKLAQDNIYSHTLDHSFHSKLYEAGQNTAITQLIIRIRDERFVQKEDSHTDNDLIWLPTIPFHLDLANALMEKDIPAAVKAIDAINNYGFNLQ